MRDNSRKKGIPPAKNATVYRKNEGYAGAGFLRCRQGQNHVAQLPVSSYAGMVFRRYP
jgi:hypothetical protein